jgi:hypothetical protein
LSRKHGASSEANPLDQHFTPKPLAMAITEYLWAFGSTVNQVIEPSAGDGAFIAPIAQLFYGRLIAVEFDRKLAPKLRSVVKKETGGTGKVIIGDWEHVAKTNPILKRDGSTRRIIIGNPPFKLAERHIRAGAKLLIDNELQAHLLRLNFLGGKKRLKSRFWKDCGLYAVAPIIPRPSFSDDGRTDGTEYSVFVFKKGFTGTPQIADHIVWTPAYSKKAPKKVKKTA